MEHSGRAAGVGMGGDNQWGAGSRLVFRSALYHLKPLFVVASRPPRAPAFCQVAAADLFATFVATGWCRTPSATAS